MRTGRIKYLFCSLCSAVILVLLVSTGAAAPSPGDANTIRPSVGQGDTIIPDRWIRLWDPVTVFFASTKGPADPGTESHPEKWVTMQPVHPGSWRWLNAKTLQFKPAEPWPAFSSFSFKAGSAQVELGTVISGPSNTAPVQGEADLPPVEVITLTFPYALPEEALKRAITIALWDAPTAEGNPRIVLNSESFSIKQLEVTGRESQIVCHIMLDQPIPHSTRARMTMNLTNREEESARFVLDFTTARSFSALAAGAGENWLPLSFQSAGKTRFEPLELGTNPPALAIKMSAPPEPLTPAAWYDFIHISPVVAKMQFTIEDRIVKVHGEFEPETIYRATIRPTNQILDNRGRHLDLDVAIEFPFVFRKPAHLLRWEKNNVVVERYGPKMLPLQGRGHQTADLRIYRIDPMDRTLWPFPEFPVTTDPGSMPPFPSENATYHEQTLYSSPWDIETALATMGSPQVSEIIELPMNPMGNPHLYGLDMEKYLGKIDGETAPGTYLAGIQTLDSPGLRHWVHIQVTDLAVTTFEEPDRLTFLVTSLRNAEPVADARVFLEGYRNREWTRILSGKTDPMGVFTEKLPSGSDYTNLKRIRVERGTDVLVVDTDHPPELFRNGAWSQEGDWLYQVVNYPTDDHRSAVLGHMFTERPVYKPGDPVHIRGWLRNRENGAFQLLDGDTLEISIEGPGGLIWSSQVTASPHDGFYYRFHQQDAPAGKYHASVLQGGVTRADCSFRMEDYRLPQFEVLLHGIDTAPLDAAFDVTLTAKYYAGGVMIDRPVAWRVTQHPLSWQAATLPDFKFAVDDRFTSRPGLRESALLNTVARTDPDGGAVISINPLEELSLAPRNYVIEATVTGVDGQTVTAVKQIKALPAFLLGIKSPRIIEPGKPLVPQIAVIGVDSKFETGREVTVRLLRRTWHTVLKAGNYSAGDLKYETRIVETPLSTTTVLSSDEPVEVSFPVEEAGVYVVEATARDRIGRAQAVAMDVFVQGQSPVVWEKAPDRTFGLKTAKESYEPGETAEILIESPFQNAEAVSVVESPDGLRFTHAAVRDGACILRIPVETEWCPGIPISVLLMRGRLPKAAFDPQSGIDLGKPQTLAAMLELKVSTNRHTARIGLEHPVKAVPGETISLTIKLENSERQPLSGEAAVWLVDRAVLALGREPPFDPLNDMLKPFNSRLGIRDTREFVTGLLPGIYTVGGGFGEDMTGSIFDRMSLRKKFDPVPFYDPFVQIGSDGKTTLSVELPDNLTEFAVRVKASSGTDRFGSAESRLAVRLPVVMQPTLPRFLRPGDRFEALGISRIVEGDAGAGRISIQAEGLDLTGEPVRNVNWEFNMPVRTGFELTLPSIGTRTSSTGTVLIRLAAERVKDGTGDAAETSLPVIDGSRDWVQTWQKTLKKGERATIPAIDTDAVLPETVRREIRVSSSPILLTALQAESLLADYPYGCTEQRISRALGFLAMKSLRERLSLPGDVTGYDDVIRSTIDYLPAVTTPEGLLAFWPGGKGRVFLTARGLRFLAEARKAGYEVDPLIAEQFIRSLKASLRSDSRYLVDGSEIEERVMALEALSVFGIQETGYIEEMARQADSLGTESRARIVRLFAGLDGVDANRLKSLTASLWDDIVFLTRDGKLTASGIRSDTSIIYIILMSDTTALAEVTRTMIHVAPDDPRIAAMIDGLTNTLQARWMSTWDSSAALTVFDEVLSGGHLKTPVTSLAIGNRRVNVGDNTPVIVIDDPGTGELQIDPVDGADAIIHVISRGEPARSPAETEAETRGFAVQRQIRRVTAENRLGEQLTVEKAGDRIELVNGGVIEEHIQVVNPENRLFVVIEAPLAAGLEPMNPELAISPPEARPEGVNSLEPDYMEMRDHTIAWYFNVLPKGTYDFYFRTRASFTGLFTQPGAYATMMYDLDKTGSSPGTFLQINPPR